MRGMFWLQLNSRVNQVKTSLGVNEGVDGVLGFARICDPFSGPPNYTYIPENCPPEAIRIGDIPVVSKSIYPSMVLLLLLIYPH